MTVSSALSINDGLTTHFDFQLNYISISDKIKQLRHYQLSFATLMPKLSVPVTPVELAEVLAPTDEQNVNMVYPVNRP